jgi:hypothetical protein
MGTMRLGRNVTAEARKEVLGEVGAVLGFWRGPALRVPARSTIERTEQKKKITGKKKGTRVGQPTWLVSAGGVTPRTAKGGVQEDPPAIHVQVFLIYIYAQITTVWAKRVEQLEPCLKLAQPIISNSFRIYGLQAQLWPVYFCTALQKSKSSP